MEPKTARRNDPADQAPVRPGGDPSQRHVWALAALLVPVLFITMIAIGVALMWKRHMAFFRPAPSGQGAAQLPSAKESSA
jgi:hypothetical protein